MPGVAKIYIEQGATFSQTVSLFDGSDAPFDLTGYTVSSKIRPTATSPTVIATFDTSITSPPASGQFILSLPASATALLPVDANSGPENVSTIYTYDVNISTGATVIRVLQGEVVISPEVTR